MNTTGYYLSDFYTNPNTFDHILTSNSVLVKESDDMNADGALTYTKFDWTQDIKNLNMRVKAGTQ